MIGTAGTIILLPMALLALAFGLVRFGLDAGLVLFRRSSFEGLPPASPASVTTAWRRS